MSETENIIEDSLLNSKIEQKECTCVLHPNRQGEVECKVCGYTFCHSCYIEVEGEPFCKPCLKTFRVSIPVSEVPLEEDFWDREELPWIKRNEIGWHWGFIDTLKMLIKSPFLFFDSVKRADKLIDSLWFGILSAFLFSLLAIPAQQTNTQLINSFLNLNLPASEEIDKSVSTLIMFYIILPLGYILFDIYLKSFIVFIGVKLFSEKASYLKTVQIIAYSQAAKCLAMIPFLVGYVSSMVYEVILIAIGIIVIFQLSKFKSSLAALFPIFLSLILLWLVWPEMQEFLNQ